MEVLREKLSVLSGGRILDVATGKGNFIKLLRDSFKDFDEIVGIDNYEPNRLNEAEKSFSDPRITFMPMNGEKIEFEDGYFDTVCISNSLHHLKNIAAVLSEMKRVLKPGGLFIVNEMYCDMQIEPQLTHVYLHHWWADIDHKLGINHFYTFRRQEIIDILAKAALSSLDLYDYADLEVDFKEKAELADLNKIIDDYIKKAEELADYDLLRRRGEELRIRLNNIGIASASQLIAVGRK